MKKIALALAVLATVGGCSGPPPPTYDYIVELDDGCDMPYIRPFLCRLSDQRGRIKVKRLDDRIYLVTIPSRHDPAQIVGFIRSTDCVVACSLDKALKPEQR